MKNFDLNAYDVVEINPQEMKNVNGGFFWEIIVAGLIYDIVCHPGDTAKAFGKGAAGANDAADKQFH